MRWLTNFYWLLIGVVAFCQAVNAQERGAQLRFEGAANLNLPLASSFLQKSSGILYESPPSDEIAIPFDRVLFNGISADTNFSIQVSYERNAGRWSEWQEAFIKFFPNGRFWARAEAPEVNRLKYRIYCREVIEFGTLEIYAVEVFSSKSEEIEEAPSSMPIEKINFSPAESLPPPDIISRGQWGAQPPRGDYISHTPFRFAQHHTAGRRVQTLADGLAEMRFIQDFHQNGRGWQDIGYHFAVDDSGRVYAGVPPQFRGTHAGGNNTGNIGIVLMGNYDLSNEFPTSPSLASLADMWSWLAFTYGVNPDSLFGHRDYNETACPGANFYPQLPSLRNNIRKQLGFGAPYVVNPQPQPFAQEVSPQTSISFKIRDDEEGVHQASISMQVNGQPVVPTISGAPAETTVNYTPSQPFAGSQHVIVDVSTMDLAATPNQMNYSFRFQIRIEATHVEVQTPSTLRNASLFLLGAWSSDADDVNLSELTNGSRLLTIDTDNSHVVRVFPNLPQTGDYRVLMAMNTNYLGESASYRFVNAKGASQPRLVEYNSVFLRKWGSLSPTPIHFDTATPSAGFIELSGLTGVPTLLALDALRFEKVDRLEPPQPPTMKCVRRLSPGNQIQVAWYPSLEGDLRGYRLYMSEDGRAWGAPLADENTLGPGATEFNLNYNGARPAIYFRMVSVDTNEVGGEGGELQPLLSDLSDTYGVGLSGGRKILVVDNFDRLASWPLPHHSFVRNHGEALAANGLGFDSCAETAVQAGEVTLTDYDLVIYFCGDDSRSDESVAAADQWRLLNYLQSGGKLFISGSEIGYDFAATTSSELQRYRTLLRASYVEDNSGSNVIEGEPLTVFEGLSFSFGAALTEDTYFEDFPDYLQSTGGSFPALRYGNGLLAAVAYSGPFGSSAAEGQVIYLAFPFETIMTAEARAAMMNRALTYFGLSTDVADNGDRLPKNFQLSQNYPNPFSPAVASAAFTTIRFELPRPEHVKVTIYNILGQQIATLDDRHLSAGRHELKWDGRNEQQVPVAPGLYFYRMEAGDFRAVRRMMVVSR